MAADYPGRSSESRRRHSTGAATDMATREVSHGGMIMSTAASAAKSRTTPPAGPLSAPPNEVGESLPGALGAEGRVGAFGGATDLAGATFAPETGTSLGGTS